VKPSHMLGAGLIAAMAWRSTPVAAQASASASAGLFSSYVWRGVTYTNRFVIQPEVSATLPVRKATLTGGLWANVEPARYDHFSDISENGATPNRVDVTEVQWYGELGLPIAKDATLTLGTTGYIFPNDDGLTRDADSMELYAVAELAGPLKPTASVYYDVRAVKGAYFEGGLSHTLAPESRVPVTLGAAAGFSAGQDADLDASGEPQAESFNCAKDGFTHADLSATADITTGALTFSPTLHFIITGDEATKSSRIEPEPGTGLPRLNRTGAKLWFGVTVGWTR